MNLFTMLPSFGEHEKLTPWKITMEPTNHPFRMENDLNQTSMIMLHVTLQGYGICENFMSLKAIGPGHSLLPSTFSYAIRKPCFPPVHENIILSPALVSQFVLSCSIMFGFNILPHNYRYIWPPGGNRKWARNFRLETRHFGTNCLNLFQRGAWCHRRQACLAPCVPVATEGGCPAESIIVLVVLGSLFSKHGALSNLYSTSEKTNVSYHRIHNSVGGFNPIEKYESNWIISPNRDENTKTFETTT